MEVTIGSPADRAQVVQRKAPQRSRVTNGRDVLPDVDGRSVVARRYRDIASAILIDQGQELCSEARLQLIRRFAAAAVLAEQLESRLANGGEQVDINEHATLSSTLVRLAAKIGIDRVPRDVTPNLQDYLAHYDAAQPQDVVEGNRGSGRRNAHR